MNMLLFRCGGCRNFFFLKLIHFAKCNVCNFVAMRCETCGGVKGAARSVRSHVSWYKGVGVSKYGYQNLHDIESQDYQRLVKLSTSPKPLVLVKTNPPDSKAEVTQKIKVKKR